MDNTRNESEPNKASLHSAVLGPCSPKLDALPPRLSLLTKRAQRSMLKWS